MSNIIGFPGREAAPPSAAPVMPATEWGPGRSRAAVQCDIDAHVKARRAYERAVAWEAAAQDQALPACTIEMARAATETAYREMQEAARFLLICMPTDLKGLVDLMMYMEKNFSVLPREIERHGGACQSLALDLLRTVRLSLRQIAGLRKGRS